MRRTSARPAAVAFVLAAALLPAAGRADTVASLLGNFTINQFAELAVGARTAHVHYAVVYGQLPALRELHLADGDGDGVTTQAERDAYVARLAPDFAAGLVLTVDGEAVPLAATRWTTSLPTEQGGFSMRIDIDFDAPLPGSADGAVHVVHFDNRNFAGRFGWREIVVAGGSGVSVFDATGFGTSLTGGLTEALQALPSTGPLDERVVDLRYRAGDVPPGARALAARDGSAAVVPGAVAKSPATSKPSMPETPDWLQVRTRELVALISAPSVPVHVAIVALLAAMLLGALHAFSPGHGKTIVGAYLIGSRSTPRHAVFLGATVTITHTLVVFAVGLATLVASRWVLPERLFPALSLLSGLLVLGMGLVLFMQRWPAARTSLARRLERALDARDAAAGRAIVAVPYRRVAVAARFGMAAAGARPHRHVHATAAHRHDHAHAHPHDHEHVHDHAHPHDHSHGDDHAHAHPHAGGGALFHSHGGSVHSHLPPGATGERVSWKSLLALGVSGGLVPCPSAMVLLLAAIALNKTFYGLLLVVAFSVGLALTLIAVGLAFLYARQRFRRPAAHATWPEVLPALSAVLITVVGLFLCYGALTSATFRPPGA